MPLPAAFNLSVGLNRPMLIFKLQCQISVIRSVTIWDPLKIYFFVPFISSAC